MYRSLIIHSVKTDLFFGALELRLFDGLDKPTSVSELHLRTGFDRRSLALCLDALASAKFIRKEEDKFCNTERTQKYLSSESPSYIGDLILHRRRMFSVDNLVEILKNGGKVTQKIDFQRLAELTGKEMKLFRTKTFVRTAQTLLHDVPQPRFLDIGGGPGLIGIEWAKRNPQVSGVIFEQKEIAEIAQQNVMENGTERQIQVIAGNFLTDDIGHSCYDLILASGVLAFCGRNLTEVCEKLYRASDKSGYLIVVTPQLKEDGLQPMNVVLSWLSNRLNGAEPILHGRIIHKELLKVGFEYLQDYREPVYQGIIYRKGL